MADLSTMFNQLGPAGGSILAGVQMGNEANAAKSEQAMRQAQMDKILMETDQAKLMNPLELQAKQQSIAAADLKAKQEKDAYRDEVLGKAIPTLAGISGPARYAAAEQIFAQAGIPLDQADKQHLFGMSPEAMLKELKAKHEWSLTQNKGYRQAVDVANISKSSHLEGARIQAKATTDAADIRAQIAKDRASAAKSDAAMLAKMGNNYAGQAAYYESKAKEAYDAGNNESYLYYKGLKEAAQSQELAKASASQNARAGADAARLEALSGNSVIVKPPKPLSIEDKRNAL